jgi:hypothetical protein
VIEFLAEKLFVLPVEDPARAPEHDDAMPSLRAPPLFHKLNRYSDSVKPFLIENELTATVYLVSEFEKVFGRNYKPY